MLSSLVRIYVCSLVLQTIEIELDRRRRFACESLIVQR